VSLFRPERRALPTSIDPNQLTARPIFGNWSGEVVNEGTAFTSSAVSASVTLLADSVATMPLSLQNDKQGRWQNMPLPSVFKRPNDEQLMFDFVQQTIATLAIHGNAFWWTPMKGIYPLEIRNIHPSKVRVKVTTDGRPQYQIGKDVYDSSEIKHIVWMRMPNQPLGISPIDVLRNIIGTDIAINRFLSAWYGDGGTPSSVLETDGTLTQEQAQILRETWIDTHYKNRKPAVLTGGLKWKPITASAADMDTMAHREQLVREIARFYRIPLHLILGTGGDSQTYQNVESAGIIFVRHTLLPWMRRLEDALSDLVPANQRLHFNADEFMRADLATRIRAAQMQISAGMLTPNEARHIENREPYEGGDRFVLNLPGAPMAGTPDLPFLGEDAEKQA